MSKEFDLEFTSDEHMNAVLDAITEQIQSDEKRTAMLSPIRLQQMEFSHAVLKRLTDDLDDVSLTYELHKPFKTMGYITIEGKNITFADSEWFSRAAEFASNMEIYPLEANKVRLTLTFHGLTVPVE